MDPDNPYAPPSAGLARPPAPPSEDELASTGQRLVNLLIDFLAIGVFGFVMGGLSVAWDPDPEPRSFLENQAFGILLNLVYYTGFEGLLGRTPGKLLTGTRVVASSGGQPSATQILGRSLARMVPFEPFSFLGGRGHPVGWHDAWSKTRVVRVRD